MVEGAPLLRAYGGKTSIEGSNPSLSAKYKTGPCAPFLYFTDTGDRWANKRKPCKAGSLRAFLLRLSVEVAAEPWIQAALAAVQ